MNKTPILFTVFLSAAILSCNLNLPGKSGTKEAYFVNAEAGNDKNPGSVRKPLKTISEANKRVLTDPRSIFLAGEQVFEGTILLNNIQGSDHQNSDAVDFKHICLFFVTTFRWRSYKNIMSLITKFS